ncbi:MAG: InlB B-repeat-containing protein, partial [Firmicutes bacterium]|nr:InlB B-repeat-containing protein [Candidatus Colimorpha enterica]
EEIGGSLSAQIDVLTDKISRLNIGEGSYRIAVYAEIGAQYPGQDACKEEKLVAESTFGVDSAVTDPVPPFIEGLDVLSFDGKTVTVGVRATDDKYLFGTELKAGNEDYGYIVYSYEKAEGDLFIFKVDLDDFEGVSGSIKLIATATDAHNNKTVKERLFYIPEATAGETWSAGSGINLRSAPSTTASKVKTVKSGTKVVLVEVVEDGTYVWAKTSDGYYTVLKQKSDSSLWYKYVSGNMFNIVFDYNNGNGSCTVPKRFGEAVDLSGIVPERNGYTFCGWAYSSDAKSPDYLPGGKYTADKNAVLFAVWKDEIKPTFGRVEIENTKWTNKGVNVTVVATDNSGTVFYSFDGGKNWSYNDTYFVRSNTVFGAEDIAIKDEDGNIVYYGETVTVKNIDKNAPSVERFSGEAKVSGSEVTFLFEGATDAESGIGGFEITYSTKSDYADSTTVPAVSGVKEKLTDGVYYWKVRAYDEAGNYAEAECGRFRIGEAKKLGTPYSLIAAVGASYCDLSWEEVENADGYSVEVSLSSSFDDSVIVSAPSSFATVKQLVSGRKYYVRITALSEDGNFLDSDYAETTFETQSDDSTIYSFKYLADATVNEALHTCDYIAEYGTSSLDLSVETAGNADVKYYSDNTLTNEIKNYADYSLTGSSATVYILVSAENGS